MTFSCHRWFLAVSEFLLLRKQFVGEIILARHEIPNPTRNPRHCQTDDCQTAYQNTFRAWYHQFQNMGTHHLDSSSTMDNCSILNPKTFCWWFKDQINIETDVCDKNLAPNAYHRSHTQIQPVRWLTDKTIKLKITFAENEWQSWGKIAFYNELDTICKR